MIERLANNRPLYLFPFSIIDLCLRLEDHASTKANLTFRSGDGEGRSNEIEIIQCVNWCDLYFTDPARLEDEAVLQVRRPFHPRLDDGRQCGGCTRSFHFFDLYQHASFVEKFLIINKKKEKIL